MAPPHNMISRLARTVYNIDRWLPSIKTSVALNLSASLENKTRCTYAPRTIVRFFRSRTRCFGRNAWYVEHRRPYVFKLRR